MVLLLLGAPLPALSCAWMKGWKRKGDSQEWLSTSGGKSPPGTHQVVPQCQTGRVVSSLPSRTQISQLLGFPSA